MDVLVLLAYILYFAFAFKGISTFITRLPACKYSANYTVRRQGKYFQGNVGATIRNVSRRQCTLYCTLRNGCVFFNHKVDGTMCELLTSHIGTLEDNPVWSVISTNYTEWKFRGPICRFLRPLCSADTEYCIDTCEAPGYQCKQLENIARGKLTNASSVRASYTGSVNIVDGQPKTYWTSVGEGKPWVMIDLGAPYKILFITIFNVQNSNFMARLKFLTIRIGNNEDKESNEICLDNQNQNNIAKMNYFCKNGLLIGRYVFVIRNGATNEMTLADINVYSL